ncbi:unnamed protein product [Caenorhabditis brenneri]
MAPPSTNHWKNDKRYNGLLNFIIKQTENVESPMNVLRLVKDFKDKSGAAQPISCLRHRVYKIRTVIHRIEHIDTNSKVKVLFALSAPVDAAFLKELRKDALVKVDEKKRITHYKSNDKSLELSGYHSLSEKYLLINKYFKNKNDGDVVPKNKEEKEVWNLIQLITEKCENGSSPLNITQLTKDFNNHFGSSRSFYCIWKRVKSYCREVQKTEFLDNQSKVKQLFCLGATLDSNFLKELRKDADVEVDSLNRITEYTSNNGRLTLYGDHSQSAKNKSGWVVRRKNKMKVRKHCFSGGDKDEDSEKEDGYSEDDNDSEITANASVKTRYGRLSKRRNLDSEFSVMKHSNSGGDENEESEKENGYSEDDSDEYSSEEFDSDFDSDDENDALDETKDLMEPSNKAVEFDNETPGRTRSPAGILIDINFDFDPPIERSHRSEEAEMREDDEKDDPEITGDAVVEPQRSETLPTSKTSFSTSHTPKPPKRKVDASGGSITLKRTKPLTEESMDPGNSNENISHDDPSGVELKPFRELLGLPKEAQKDSDIQQIPKPRPQAIEAPIKKEYEEGSQTSLKSVLNAYKSLILSLDTPGLLPFQMELEKKIMETGSGAELTKHGALKASGDSISLRDILLMLRTIILNSSFNGLEGILEMLKENIEKLEVLDKKVPVSKVECVLRATLDSIST